MSCKPPVVALLALCAPFLVLTGAGQAKQDTTQAAGASRCAPCHLEGGGGAPPVDARALGAGVHGELDCTDCHVGVEPNHGPDVPPADCSDCHGEAAAQFERSVHWRRARSGAQEPHAPGCADCHGHHDIKCIGDLSSPVTHERVASRCGACHVQELAEYSTSSHAAALADSAKASLAPTCTTCHGEHDIFVVAASASPASRTELPRTCGGCHDDARLAEELGVPADRLKTYSATIHGLRNRFGVSEAATCADCHGAHKVLGQSDQESTISQGNLVSTCGACHSNANENFVQARIHIEADPDSSPGVFVVRWFYVFFIGLLMLGFLSHVILDLIHRRRSRKEAASG